jgi:hypothetical protein
MKVSIDFLPYMKTVSGQQINLQNFLALKYVIKVCTLKFGSSEYDSAYQSHS